jgi:hypothetical protein
VFISLSANRRPFAAVLAQLAGLRELVRYVIVGRFFSPPKKIRHFKCAKAAEAETNHKARSSTPRPIIEMPTGTIEFKCIRINLKRISTFEPDESQIDSLIEFDLKIGDERLRGLRAEVRQLNGTDFQNQPLEVGNVIGYNGPWNYEEFRDFCERYYRDVIGSSGMGRIIKRGQRNLIERIAIRLDRLEEINLPSSTEKMMHANAGE